MDNKLDNVAKAILSHFPNGISTRKLQKLAFYSQGVSLAIFEEPLFDEEFQAWQHGPVCRELFQKHKGEFSVSTESFPYGNPQALTPNELMVIDAVISTFGYLSGDQLSDLTHQEDTPWSITRKKNNLNPDESSDAIIEKDLIKEYFISYIVE